MTPTDPASGAGEDTAADVMAAATQPTPRAALLAARKALPIAEAETALVAAIRDALVTVIVGETGSGKTTQLPQYLLAHGLASGTPLPPAVVTAAQRLLAAAASKSDLTGDTGKGHTTANKGNDSNTAVGQAPSSTASTAPEPATAATAASSPAPLSSGPPSAKRSKESNWRGLIAVTQPRRVAAMTVARRVAEEQGVALGGRVGYAVRFDEKTSAATRLKFLTDGMLLREAMADRDLRKYAVVVLDEAHERTVHTDALFALVKQLVLRRATTAHPLRVVVMSATLEATAMARYFGCAGPPLYIAGRTFPVDVRYAQTPQPDYVEAAVVTALQIHRSAPVPGDILLFLTGQEEIEGVERLLLDASARCVVGGERHRERESYSCRLAQ